MAKPISVSSLKHYWHVYLFVLPSVLITAVLSYYPAFSALVHAFYRWDGDTISQWVGTKNFRESMGNSYWVWLILIVLFFFLVNTAKKEGKWSEIFKVLSGVVVPIFSVGFMALELKANPPMLQDASAFIGGFGISVIIWGLVATFLYFFISEENESKWMYLLLPVSFIFVSFLGIFSFPYVFSWLFIMLILGLTFWMLPVAERFPNIGTARMIQAFASIGLAFWALGTFGGGDPSLWSGFAVIFILVVFNLLKMIPSISTAVVIHRLKSDQMNYIYRVLFVVPMIIPGMVQLLLWKFFFDPGVGLFNRMLVASKVMNILVWLDGALAWGGVFVEGQMPVWLGNEHLVIPAMILWGFPWVGIIGVLIYLAGLQGISLSVYEAADLDGATALQKFFNIELPLILTQVRINLVLMIIRTLKGYSFIMILFGIEGGPNGKLLVPGLYMFSEAFSNGRAGYACAVGLVIFFFILMLTELNNKFIRVEK